jgi:hypothetical protein
MNQLRQQTAKNGLQRIMGNVAYMRRGKGYLEIRQVAIRRALRRIEQQLTTADDIDEMEDLQDVADNLSSISSDLESYRDHLEVEFEKINRGISSLILLREKSGRNALTAYLTEDTELSVSSLMKARFYYDQVIDTLKTLKDESVG